MEDTNTEQISDEQLTNYLLGRLSFEKEETIDLALADDDFFSRITAIEEDLIDDYAQGKLAGEEQRLVEQRLLNTIRQREQLAHARALFSAARLIREAEAAEQAAAADQDSRSAQGARTVASGSWRQWLTDLFRIPMPALATGLAFVAIVLLAGGTWVAYELRSQSGEVSRLRGREQELSRQNEDLTAINTQKEKQINQANQQLTEAKANNDKLREQFKQNRGAGYFTAGGFRTAAAEGVVPRPREGDRGNEPRIEVPGEIKLTLMKDSTLALLQLLITNDANSSYRVVLNAESGLPVLRMNGLKAKSSAGDNHVKLAFPADLLEPGKYKLEVTGNDNQRTWIFNLNVERQ